jgi:thiamine-monophosphate kinase
MALSEFSLIDRYFKTALSAGCVGVGDDAAVMPWVGARKLVACKDVLVQGRHFFADVDPAALGHKSLAVNLSDLAALGATPVGCLLGLALPRIDEPWLEHFSAGLQALAHQWGCPLIGGDTVSTDQGIVISVTALGSLPQDQPGLLRSAARIDDDIWFSGQLGAADLALRILQGSLTDPHDLLSQVRDSLERPQPRIALGQRLLEVANAAIDISDGLVQDLGHLLQQSQVGAVLELDLLPAHPSLAGLPEQVVQQAILGGGDVYELCFTAAPERHADVLAIGQSLGLQLTCIGRITAGGQLMGRRSNGDLAVLSNKGFDHFSGAGA